jgi:tetratricopeptide (TPR) repeat protein
MRLLMFGRPTLLHVTTPVKLRRKALGLLAVVVERGRPCNRTWLAQMLWGPEGLANLRQELAALRRLPHAETWLRVDDSWVTIELPSDLADARRAHTVNDLPMLRTLLARGPLLEGFEDLGQEPFQHWLDDLSGEVDAWLPAERAPASVAEQLVAEVLCVTPPRVATDDHIHRWLGLPLWQVVHARSALLEAGTIDARGHWLAAPRPWPQHLARKVVELAVHSDDLQDDLIPAVRCCADPTLQTTWWGRRSAQGDRASAEEALAAAPPAMHAAACARAAELAVRALDLDRAATLTQELRTRAVTTQAPQALFDAELLTARLCIARGQLDASAQPFAEARRLAESHLDPDAVARVDGLHGQVLAATGQTSEARRCLQRAAEGPDAHSRAIALVGLGMLEAQTGNFASAANLHDRALTATRDLGDRDASARVLNNLGASAERIGWFVRAAQCFEDAILLADAREDHALGGTARVNLAEVLRRQGALGASRRRLGEAFDRLAHSPGLPPQANQVRADLELSCGRDEEAAHWFAKASAGWSELGRPEARLADWMGQLAQGSPHDELAHAIDDLPLPAQRDLARLELALRCEDPMALEALLGGIVAPHQGDLETLRATLAPHSKAAAASLAGLPAEGPVGAPMVRLLARRAPHDPAAAARLSLAMHAACDGLLPSQREAYRHKVLTPRPPSCPAPR